VRKVGKHKIQSKSPVQHAHCTTMIPNIDIVPDLVPGADEDVDGEEKRVTGSPGGAREEEEPEKALARLFLPIPFVAIPVSSSVCSKS